MMRYMAHKKRNQTSWQSSVIPEKQSLPVTTVGSSPPISTVDGGR